MIIRTLTAGTNSVLQYKLGSSYETFTKGSIKIVANEDENLVNFEFPSFGGNGNKDKLFDNLVDVSTILDGDNSNAPFTIETLLNKFLSFGYFNNGGGNGGGGSITLDDLFTVERNAEGQIITTVSIYDFKAPPNSILLGNSIKITDLGQILGFSTAYNDKEYLLISQEIDQNGIIAPTAKISPGPSSFDLQPIDDLTESFNTPVEFEIISQQNVIGKTYTLKLDSLSDVNFKVIRLAENGGEDVVLVDEDIPSDTLSLNGVSFDLTPIVDFETSKAYRLRFTAASGGIQLKGTAASVANANGIAPALNTTFLPYIRREVGYVYETKELLTDGNGSIIDGSSPPSDTNKKWFNTTDEKLYFYDGTDWLSEQLFEVVFNDQGTTPNNTFFRVGNTVTNETGVGYNLDFTSKIESLSFNRLPGTVQPGNYWLYSNTATGTNNAAVVTVFAVDSSARGSILPNTETIINANSYISVRWNGNQTNNNIVTVKYRKKYE